MAIQRVNITTKLWNTLAIFYNPDNDLLTIDIVDKSELGGNEIVRMTLDEKALLKPIQAMVNFEERATKLIKGKPLSDMTNEELLVVVQYHHWKDGMDYGEALKIKDFTREQLINNLKTVWGF